MLFSVVIKMTQFLSLIILECILLINTCAGLTIVYEQSYLLLLFLHKKVDWGGG